MKGLLNLQKEFQNYVFKRGERMEREVVGTRRASAKTRLGIYSGAYRLRLLEALDTDYPALRALAGDDEFEKLGYDYIESHPSPYYNMRWYGGELAEFLKITPPYNKHPALSEMAAFEWIMALAFDAPDDPVVTVEEMAKIPAVAWPALVFAPHASLQRLNLEWNVPVFWKAVDKKDQHELPLKNEYPVAWVLWRRGLNTYFRSISVQEAWALDAMRIGNTFAEICSGLCEWIDELQVAQYAAGMLKSWIAEGMITKVSFTGQAPAK
ncbi:MAG TPA: DNA-binding domain-containing protein [Burkholderiales bacterium]|nr:DNA-binding domain-containing protein [Burkholderiales bacterium]